MALAVKVVLNPNTTNQPTESVPRSKRKASTNSYAEKGRTTWNKDQTVTSLQPDLELQTEFVIMPCKQDFVKKKTEIGVWEKKNMH